jgi:hypothetical protein
VLSFTFRQGENSDPHYHIDAPWGHLPSEISQSQKDKHCDSIFVRFLEPADPQSQKVQGWVPGAGEEDGELGSNGDRVSV